MAVRDPVTGKSEVWLDATKLALSALGVIFCSTALIIYNRWFLKDCTHAPDPSTCKGWGFPFPLLLTFSHLCMISAVCFVLVRVLKVVEPPRITQSAFMRGVVPFAFLVSAEIALSNSGFLYLEASFIAIVKCASPVAVYAVSVLAGLDGFSWSMFGIVSLISGGLGLASIGEANFSLKGFLIVIAATFMSAMRITLSQILTQHGPSKLEVVDEVTDKDDLFRIEDDDDDAHTVLVTSSSSSSAAAASIEKTSSEIQTGAPAGSAASAPAPPNHSTADLSPLQVMYLQTPVSALLLLPLALFSAYEHLPGSRFVNDWDFMVATCVIIVAGVGLGLAMSALNLQFVKLSSALALTVVGVLKTAVTIAMSWWTFQNELTAMNLGGFGLCILGVVLYNCEKYRLLAGS